MLSQRQCGNKPHQRRMVDMDSALITRTPTLNVVISLRGEEGNPVCCLAERLFMGVHFGCWASRNLGVQVGGATASGKQFRVT